MPVIHVRFALCMALYCDFLFLFHFCKHFILRIQIEREMSRLQKYANEITLCIDFFGKKLECSSIAVQQARHVYCVHSKQYPERTHT